MKTISLEAWRATPGVVFLAMLLAMLMQAASAAKLSEGETDAPYVNPKLGLKLDHPEGGRLLFRTENFARHYPGIALVEFRSGSGDGRPQVFGAVLRFAARKQDFKAWASRRPLAGEDDVEIVATELIREEPMDRSPGQWLLREWKVTTDKGVRLERHICISDGTGSFFQLIIFGDIAQGEALGKAMDQITAVASFGGGQMAEPKKLDGVAGLVFSSLGNERDLYLLKEGTTKAVNITNHPGRDWQPAFSPDASQIAFLSDRDTKGAVGRSSGIYVMNVDGSDVRRVVTSVTAQHPRWSPDGKQLVYDDRPGATGQVRIVNVDGSGDRLLVESAGDGCREPDWSPDGKTIVCMLTTQGVADSGLYLINADGSEKRMIISTVRMDTSARHPRFSRDGKQIIFTGRTWQENPLQNEHPDLFGAVMICNADGTGLHFEHMHHAARPVLMPKSNKIAFMAVHGGDYVNPSGHAVDVFVKNINQVHTQNITQEAGAVFDFDISPLTSDDPLPKREVPCDIAFSRNSDGVRQDGSATGPGPSMDIFVISEDGKRWCNLTQTITYYCRETMPCWSPDKKKIVYASNQPYWVDGELRARSDSMQNIWVMDADGSNKINLTRHHGIEHYPTWSPDGMTIAFQRSGVGLMLMDANGGNVRQVKGNRNSLPRRMTWSNDGQSIVIGGATGGYKMEAGTINTDPPVWEFVEKGSAIDPDWNPTSTEIAHFGFNVKEKWALLRFAFPAGMTAEVVEQGRGSHPSWDPTGCRIAFDQGNQGGSQILIADIHKHDPKDLINLTKLIGGNNVQPDWAAGPSKDWKKSGDDKIAKGGITWVLKGCKPRFRHSMQTTPEFESPPGYTVTETRITRRYDSKIGLGDDARPVTYNGVLEIAGPPATLKPGERIELSMTASGDYQTEMMGEWSVSPSAKPEGVNCVNLSHPDARDTRPAGGKLKIVAPESSPYGLGFSVTLDCNKFVSIRWEYEEKK